MSVLISCVRVEASVFVVLVTSRVPASNLCFFNRIIDGLAEQKKIKDCFNNFVHQLSSSDELDPVLSSVVVVPPKCLLIDKTFQN